MIYLLHKCGVCISYNDLLLLYDALALEDVEISETCAAGIAADKPLVLIADSDDFTITTNAAGVHLANVLYIQPASYEEKKDHAPETIQHTNKKEVTKQLDKKFKKLTAVQHYMCPHYDSSEPPVRSRVSEPVNDLRPQRMAEDHKEFGHFIQRILVLPPFFNLRE